VLREPSNLPAVDADPQRLLQVLSNLVNNALKFTPAGGRVEIQAQSAGDFQPENLLSGRRSTAVRFTVRDTGTGISSQDLGHVFDWYWQSPTGGEEGAGLGLAIAKGLIEAHRSRLNVESVVGAGTSFWFTMPAANGDVTKHNGHGGLIS
jgi:signal transduction histidine kinase